MEFFGIDSIYSIDRVKQVRLKIRNQNYTMVRVDHVDFSKNSILIKRKMNDGYLFLRFRFEEKESCYACRIMVNDKFYYFREQR